MKLRHGLFAIDSKYKKNKKYVDDESDLDDDAVADHEETMKALQIEKAQKKFAKDNEKLLIEGEQPQVDSVLKEKIKDIEEEFKRLKKERGTGRAAFKRERPAEKIEEAIENWMRRSRPSSCKWWIGRRERRLRLGRGMPVPIH